MSTPPVLLVDKMPSVQTSLRSLLRRRGLDMVAVGTAIEARARFHQIRPDIVVLDTRLPDVERFDLISEFRSVAPDIRIIVTTSDNSTRHIVATMRAGAFDILVKPLREAPFISAIEDALASLAKSRFAERPHLVEMIGTSKA